MLLHAVLFSLKEGVSEDTKQRVLEMSRSLQESCGGTSAGILFLRYDKNLDLRKKVDWVEFAVFTDNDALQRFRNHPVHKEFANEMSKIADWKVGDLLV